MDTFNDFLAAIKHPDHQARTREVLQWVRDTFPQLQTRIAWNQPAFTDHGTFIIAFSVAAGHLAAAPETVALNHFDARIRQEGYTRTKMLLRIPWDRPVPYALLKDIIAYNIEDKKGCQTYWRKP